MENKKNIFITFLSILFTVLVFSGCSQTLDPALDTELEDNVNSDEEVTPENVIEDVVVTDLEEDVEIGDLI
jgi:PBP1b-binding outer membrane lipoprotein LpoB